MDASRASACTYPLIEMAPAEAFDAVKAAGFTKIDLLGRYPHFDASHEDYDREAVKAEADKRGLKIASLGTYIGGGFTGDAAACDAEAQAVKEAIDAAVFFGARAIRVLRGRPFDKAEFIDAMASGLRCVASYAEEKDVYMGVENHGGELSGSPELTKKLFEAVGSSHFGLIYDPCNYVTHGADYRAALELQKEHVVHVHFKDAATNGSGTKLTMLGEGDIDFVWAAKVMEDAGYAGDYALEFELETQDPAGDLKKWYEAFAAM